jgi:hypothetical protein
VALGKFQEFGSGDFAFDYEALRVGPVSETDGGLAMAPTLAGEGAPIATLSQSGERLAIGERRYKSVAIERISFVARSDDIDLSAEIVVPRGVRRGCVILIYGSGPAPKEAFDLWAFWFLGQGFSVIAYDKRGSGASGGDWRTAGLETLSDDARSVIAVARSAFPHETGTLLAWGASQGGWILPQLGAEGAVDGLIMHAGSAMKPADQILAAVEAELRAYGFPADEIARAKAYYALDTDVSRGVRRHDEIVAAYEAAAAEGAEWLLGPPAAADAPERTMIRLMADFDPIPYWRRNKIATLAIFGGKDVIVPAAPNRDLFADCCADNADFESRTLPEANHLMFIADTGVRAEYAARAKLDPGYFSAISDWLDERWGPRSRIAAPVAAAE